MSDERPTSTSTSQSSSPPPPPSELYAYKLRDDGYDVALLPPSPRSSTQLVAPRPSVPFSPFSLMEGTNANMSYPPPGNRSSTVTAIMDDDATSVSLYSTVTGTSESQRRRSLASPPPASLLPYATAAEASRPSSTAGFLQQTSHPMQPQIHPMPGSPLTAPFMAPHPHPRAGSGSTLLTPPSRKHSRSDTIASADTPHPALIRIPSEETRVLAQAQAAQNRNAGSGGRGRGPARGMVVLYRLDEPKHMPDVEALLPPHLPFGHGQQGGKSRDRPGSSSSSTVLSGSVRSTATRQSFMSIDSRIPLVHDGNGTWGGIGSGSGNGKQMVAYAYQPDALLDGEEDDEDDDYLHDPRVSFYATPRNGKQGLRAGYKEDTISVRGVVNYTTIWLVLVAIIALFVFYPVTEFNRVDADEIIANNANINSTGQATAR